MSTLSVPDENEKMAGLRSSRNTITSVALSSAIRDLSDTLVPAGWPGWMARRHGGPIWPVTIAANCFIGSCREVIAAVLSCLDRVCGYRPTIGRKAVSRARCEHLGPGVLLPPPGPEAPGA